MWCFCSQFLFAVLPEDCTTSSELRQKRMASQTGRMKGPQRHPKKAMFVKRGIRACGVHHKMDVPEGTGNGVGQEARVVGGGAAGDA